MARILLLDDSDSVRALVRQWLTEAGHDVVMLNSGQGARVHLRQGAVDLVITDIFMPEVDGLEILQLVRQEAPHLPCIAMSSVPRKLDMLPAARAFGAAATLRKPFQASQLFSAISTALASSCADPRQSTRNASS